MKKVHGRGVGGSSKTEAAPQLLESPLLRVEPQKKFRCFPCFGSMDGALVVARQEAGKDKASLYLLGRKIRVGKAKWGEILTMFHWTPGRRWWERKAALGYGGKRNRRKRRLHMVAWMSGRQSSLTSVYSWGLAGPQDTCAGWGSLCPWMGIVSWAAEHMDPWFVVHMFLDIW